MDDRTKFWANPARWPNDGPGYVFLARALHEVGRALFDNAWTGAEPIAPEPLDLPCLVLPDGTMMHLLSQERANQWQKMQIHDLLSSHRPDFDRGPMEFGPFGLEFSDHEWTAGLEVAREVDIERRKVKQRYSEVVARIVEALRDGSLISALRPLSGGRISEPLDAHVWNTEKTENRFYWCQMNPLNPFGIGVGGDAYQFIFVSRQSLDNMLAGCRAPRPPADRSPKKRHNPEKVATWFDRIAEKVRKGQRKQPTRKEIEAEAAIEFPGISIPQVRATWSTRRPEEWAKRGPRAK